MKGKYIMGKNGFLGRAILFVSALFMLVVFPVCNAKAETNYILTEDGKLVEDTNAYHSQIEPRVIGINLAAETAAPARPFEPKTRGHEPGRGRGKGPGPE